MAATASVNQTSDPYINGLLGSSRWASGNLTYSFPISSSQYELSYGSGEPSSNFGQLSAAQQNAARAAFASYAAVANITFTELGAANASTATMRIALSDKPGTAWGYFPTTATEGGDVWLNKSSGAYANPVKGNYAFTTFVHEIGHALGLKHPHEGAAMPSDRDFMEYTVMSYRSYAGQSSSQGYVNETWGYAQSPMMYDIAALQSMYGANFSTNSGNTTYSWSPTTGQMFINGVGQGTAGGNKILMTVWDGGGNDTYDFSNYSTNLRVDLRPGNWTITSVGQLARLSYDGAHLADGNIANALLYNGDLRSLIESAVGGTGNDTIIGNQAANTLHGGNGDDFLQGLEGNDVLVGGAGLDTAVFLGFSSEYTVTIINGGYTVQDRVAGRDGFDTLSGIETLQFGNGTYSPANLSQVRYIGSFSGWVPAGIADLNGDSTDDIVWRDSSTGRTDVWLMRNGQPSGYTLAESIGGWTLTGVGDFNGDNSHDIVWQQDSTGRTDVWLMQSGRPSGFTLAESITGWTLAGVGDLNGDNTDDIVWRENSTGRTDVWLMQNGQPKGYTLASNITGWTLAEIGDLNGDETDDLIWRENSTGRTDVWLMRNGHPSGSTLVSTLSGWTLVELADLNGDGTQDIIWREDSTRQLDAWLMHDGQPNKYDLPAALGSWDHIVSGDFDNNGKDELLLSSAFGDHAYWDSLF